MAPNIYSVVVLLLPFALLPSFVSFFLHFLDKMNVLGKWQVACGNWSVWQVSVVGSNVKWRDSDSERLPHTCSQESNDACPANKFRPVGSSSSVAAPHVACGCTGSCSLQLHCCCCKLRNDVRFVWLSMTTIYVLYIHDMCVAWVAHEFISWTMFCGTKICWF